MAVTVTPGCTQGHYHLYPHTFHVGPIEYELVLVDGDVISQGQLRAAAVNHAHQQILVSTHQGRDQMTHAAMQKLYQAWTHHFTDWATADATGGDRVATILTQMLKDLGMAPIAPSR